MLFWLLLAVGVAAVAGSSSTSSSPSDVAVWKRDDGSPGRDVANDGHYAPPHLFSPDGLPIVRRYDEATPGTPFSYFLRYEVDSAGRRWLSRHVFDFRSLGDGLDEHASHDALYWADEDRDFHGSTDWRAVVDTIFSVAQFVLSVVPGIGTGINAAIGAGIALAKGQTISEAIIAGARAAVPGAPATTAAFDTAYELAKGGSLSDAALAAARRLAVEKFGEAGGRSFDIALALGHGQSIQQAAYAAVRAYIPDQNLREFADRVAQGQNVVDAAKAVGGEAAARVARNEIASYAPAAPVDSLIAFAR